MTKLIAEVGSNWEDLTDCLSSISIAKEAGADAVKFQAFTEEALYGFRGEEPMKHALPLGWLPALREKADSCDIELMCTAFSPELVAAVDPFVETHKIASGDLNYPSLLVAVTRTGKPALLSTGAATELEIETAIDFLLGAQQVTLLYCVAAYPADFADLAVMDDLRDWALPVGFSDHTLGISMAVEASRQGASVIEKHFTAFPELNSPDRPHSVDPGAFERMAKAIRGVIKPRIGPTPEEGAMILRHKRRLLAVRDIKAGEILAYGVNYGAFRALENDAGLSPFDWLENEGKPAKTPIKRGRGIWGEHA